MVKVGIIGGTGIYNPSMFDNVRHEEPVSIEQVVENAVRNEKAVQDIILTAIGRIPGKSSCQCGNALSGAIATSPDAIPVETRRKLSVLLERYNMTT